MKSVKMRIKYIILLVFFNYTYYTYAQQNHYIVLQKSQTLGQVYSYSKTFPKDWIKEKWDQSYRITQTNFKNGEWFIVMDKKSNPKAQIYRHSPKKSIIREKINDGYEIEDMCLYIYQDRIKSFYVFTKIKKSPVKQYYYSGPLNWHPGFGAVDDVLDQRIKDGWDRGYTCDSGRSLTHKGNTHVSILMHKLSTKPSQVYEIRKEFPNDYINNKKSDGYYLSSIAYDAFEKSWFVVMSKHQNAPPWTWFNFKSQRDKFNDYYKNKGYIISGVY